MKNTGYQILALVFSIFWILFILLDYWQKHPLYYHAFANFRYYGLAIVYGLFIGGLVYFVSRKKAVKKPNKLFNWLTVCGSVLLLMLVSVQFYQFKINEFIDFPSFSLGNYFTLIGKALYVAITTLFVMLTANSLGNLLSQFFGWNYLKGSKGLIETALGLIGVTSILFVLGFIAQKVNGLELLRAFILFPIFILLIALNWKHTFQLVKDLLLKPIELDDNINWLGALSFGFLLIILAINFVQILRPIPTGFDALTLYVNLPSIIRDHGALVEGYQPYNWSLLMSLGFSMFNQTEVVLAISTSGGILSLIAMYYLGKNWLNININYLLLGIAIFYLTPTIVHQSSKELKVDLGLMFYHLCIIILFVRWYKNQALSLNNEEAIEDLNGQLDLTNQAFSFGFIEKLFNNKWLQKFRDSQLKYVVLIGLFTGFALGIKLTSLFILFAVIAGFWFAKGGRYGYLAIFCFAIFGILLLRFDDMGDLRQYHLSANWVMLIMLLLGLALFAILFKNDRVNFIHKIKTSVLYVLIAMIPFLPWVGKNFIETKATNVNELLNGKRVGPKISAQKMQQNWVEYQNKRK